jgi:hypothetical protein
LTTISSRKSLKLPAGHYKAGFTLRSKPTSP